MANKEREDMKNQNKMFAMLMITLMLQACGGSSDSSGSGTASALDFTNGFPTGTYTMTSLSCYGATDTTAQMQLVVNGTSIEETVISLNGCSFQRSGTFTSAHVSDDNKLEMEYTYAAVTSSSGNCSNDYTTELPGSSWNNGAGPQNYDAPTTSGNAITLESTDLCDLEPVNNSPTGSAVLTFTKQ
jgi:hypothetical protein